MYLKQIRINRRRFPTQDLFPFNVPAFQDSDRIDVSSRVTFFVGENGSGKSTLLDAIARKIGFLPWGGSKTHRSHENPYETQLANHIDLVFEPRHRYGFHFRAEAFFNFASSLDDMILDDPGREKYYGGKSLNVLSHGESFLTFFKGYSFQLDGLYLIDEPEAALSPQNQVEFVRLIHETRNFSNKQYIIATHSPIILGCPGGHILTFDTPSIQPIEYSQTASYVFYKNFLSAPKRFFQT